MDFAPGATVTGAQALIASLEREGVEHIFGIPGGTILPAYDPLLDSTIRHILCRHEQGAAHAADGYAQVKGKPAVCFATSGPGATNLVTGIASAWMDSIPMVCVTGQVSRAMIGGDAFQEADVTGICMPITKHSWLVTSAQDIPEIVHQAFHIATTGRPGPVLIDVPKDVFQEEMQWWYPEDSNLPGYRVATTGHQDDIDEAVRLISESRKPLFYVGGGVIRGGASEALRELVDLTQIPVVTTLMGRGAVDDTHELSLGMPGMHGNYTAVTAMQKSDLLISLGVRFDDRVTGKLDAFAPNAQIIHVDIDASELGKNRRVDVGIHGSVADVIPQITTAYKKVKARDRSDFSDWVSELRDWQRRYPLKYSPQATNGQLIAGQVIERIGQMADPNAVFCSGVGQHQMWASQYLTFRHPNSWVNSGGAGTMGFAVPAGLGAKIAAPDREVWVIDGDGCFQMTCQELATMTVEGVPVKIAIMNNAYLGMVRQWQELFYDGRFSEIHLTQSLPDYVKLAEAYGCVGLRCDSPEEVDATIDKARSINDRPVVIDFRCDPAEKVYPMVPAGASNDDLILGPMFEGK